MAFARRACAADYSGTWDVGVREAGAKNFYLPMTDGRLVIEAGNRAAHYDRLNFTTSEQADGLHLACMSGTRACGALVLHLAGDRLTGSGMLADGDGLMRPVTLAGAHPAPLRAPRVIDYEADANSTMSMILPSSRCCTLRPATRCAPAPWTAAAMTAMAPRAHRAAIR